MITSETPVEAGTARSAHSLPIPKRITLTLAVLSVFLSTILAVLADARIKASDPVNDSISPTMGNHGKHLSFSSPLRSLALGTNLGSVPDSLSRSEAGEGLGSGGVSMRLFGVRGRVTLL